MKRGPTITALAVGLALTQAWAAGITRHVYYIGNSLTEDLDYPGVVALAQARGNTLIWGRHVVLGASLKALWDAGATCMSQPPYDCYPTGLSDYEWDIITLQPTDATLDEDTIYGNKFIARAKAQNPSVKVYEFGRWTKTQMGDFDAYWTSPYGGGNYLEPTADYERKLMDALTLDNPDIAPAGMVPVAHVFHELSPLMKAGQVPGFDSVYSLYADWVHLNDTGKYIAAVTTYATLFRDDPVGLPVPAQYGTIDPAVVAIFQRAVKTVLAGHPEFGGTSSGVTNPLNRRGSAVTTGRAGGRYTLRGQALAARERPWGVYVEESRVQGKRGFVRPR